MPQDNTEERIKQELFKRHGEIPIVMPMDKKVVEALVTSNYPNREMKDIKNEIKKRMFHYLEKSAALEEKINQKVDKRNIQPLYSTMHEYNARASELGWVLDLIGQRLLNK